MKYQRIREHFQKFIKIYIIMIFAFLELSLYIYTQSILNHKSIQPNQDGIRFAKAMDLENSEKKFLIAATYNFKSQKINLNRAIMYYNLKKFSDSEEILKNLEDSYMFYREPLEVHGQNSFAWGKSLLNETNCTFRETLPLWEYSRKKFNRAALLSIFQLDITSYNRNKKLETEVGIFLSSLEEWKETCLGKNSGKGESAESSGSKSDEEENQAGNRLQPLQNKDGNLKQKESRESLQSSPEISENEESLLLKSKEELNREDSYKEGEYTRFREESMEVRDLDILREIMEKAKW